MAITFASLARSNTASACASICGRDNQPGGTCHLLLPGFSSRHAIDRRRSVSLSSLACSSSSSASACVLSRSAAADSRTITSGWRRPAGRTGVGAVGGSGGVVRPAAGGTAGGGATVSKRSLDALVISAASARSHARRRPVSTHLSHDRVRCGSPLVGQSLHYPSKMSHAPVRTGFISSRALARVWRMATSDVSIVAPASVVTTAAPRHSTGRPAGPARTRRLQAVVVAGGRERRRTSRSAPWSVLTGLPIGPGLNLFKQPDDLATLPALREVGIVNRKARAARLQATSTPRARARFAFATPDLPASGRCSAWGTLPRTRRRLVCPAKA